MVTVRLISAQLLRAGVTTMCEGTLHPPHEDAIVAAIEEVGIRANMARGAADQDFHHASLYAQIKEKSWIKPRDADTDKQLAATSDFLDRHPPRGRGLIRGAVNVSALLGFSERYFRAGSALARARDTTMQVHIARDREEVEFCLSVWGRRPIERLADLGVIDEHLVAVHAVLASEGEIELLARGRASLTHSPVECVANLNAIPNIPRFRKAGIRVGLGCDNQANDMFVTMRAAWLIHGAKWGIQSYDPEFIMPGELLEMATIEAAQVLRMDDLIGSLEVGKAADIVVLDGDVPHLMSMHHLPSDIVRFATRAEVETTIVNGRVLYEAGALQHDRRRPAAGRQRGRRSPRARRTVRAPLQGFTSFLTTGPLRAGASMTATGHDAPPRSTDAPRQSPPWCARCAAPFRAVARSASPASAASTIARCSASMSRPVDLIATAMRR